MKPHKFRVIEADRYRIRNLKMKSYDFVVYGKGEFPIDMLRYDECFPIDSHGVSVITDAKLFDGNNRVVNLRTKNEHGPTVGRWESFNWNVVNKEDE